jgi:hypothetical protein
MALKSQQAQAFFLHTMRAWHYLRFTLIPLVKERVARSCKQIILKEKPSHVTSL